MMTKFLCISLLILPNLFFLGNGHQPVWGQFRIPKAGFLDIIFMGIILLGLHNGVKIIYKNKYLSYLLGWIFLSIIFYFYFPMYFFIQNGQNVLLFMIEPYIHILLGTFATYIAISSLKKEDYIQIAKFLCISAIITSLFSILQFIKIDPYGAIAKYNCGNRISAVLDNPNIVGMYLAIISPLFFIFKKKYMAWYAVVSMAILVTKSHFSIFLWGISLLTYVSLYFKKNYRVLAPLCSLALLGGILINKFDFLKSFNGFGVRLEAWEKAWQAFLQFPLIGLGLGRFSQLGIQTGLDTPNPTRWFEAHSDYLQYGIELGIIGIGLFIWMMFNSLRKFTFNDRVDLSFFVSIFTFLLFMVASFPLEHPAVALLGLIGFWYIEGKQCGVSQ